MISQIQNNKRPLLPLQNLQVLRKNRRKLLSRLRKPGGHIAGRKQQRSSKFVRYQLVFRQLSTLVTTRSLPWNRMTTPYRLEDWSYTGTLPPNYFCYQSLTWWSNTLEYFASAAHGVVDSDRTPTKPSLTTAFISCLRLAYCAWPRVFKSRHPGCRSLQVQTECPDRVQTLVNSLSWSTSRKITRFKNRFYMQIKNAVFPACLEV